MRNKKIATMLLAIVTIFATLMAVACQPIGDDPDFSAMFSSSIEESMPESSLPDQPDEPIGELITEVPASDLTISVTTELGETAQSSWFISYGESGLEIKVYVVDSTIYTDGGIYANDCIEIGIAKVQDVKGYSAGAISVFVDAAGEVKVRNLASSSDVIDSNVTAEVTMFTFDNEAIDGYIVELNVPYEATEVSKDAKDAAVLVGLTNATDFADIAGEYETTYGSIANRVNTWIAVVDSNVYEQNEHLHTKIDVLFMGDSYISTQFWNPENTYDLMMQQYGINAVNLGLSGSQIDYWADVNRVAELGLTYAPTSIVFHIGVNDIDDTNQTAQQTFDELVALYEQYHAAFSKAHCYWVSLIPNCVFTAKVEIYKETNDLMKAWAEGKDWFTYINEWDAFCSDEAAEGKYEPRPSMFMRHPDNKLEGMHLNVEYGYPLWAGIILEAIGYDLENGSVMGNNVAGAIYSSLGWTFDTEAHQAENNGLFEKAAFFNSVYSADILFEADVKTPSATQFDQWPKVGLTLKADKAQVFAYFDLPIAGETNIVYRPSTAAGVSADWLWGAQAGGRKVEKNIATDYVRMGIAKLGDTVYMLIDGVVVNTMKVPGLSASTKVVAGVMGFNQVILVKNATGTGVYSEVKRALATERTITVPEYNGANVEISTTKAKEGDVVTFTIDSTAPVTEVKVNGEVVTATNGVYSFVMPDADVSISVAFAGLLSVDLSAVNGRISASELTPYEGATVVLTPNDTTHVVKMYANGTEIVPENGVYSFVATENVVITAELLNKYNGVILDGVVDAAYGDGSTVAEYSENRTITLRAVKVEKGVILHVVAVMNTARSDFGNWWENTNLEFRLNRGIQRFVNIKGEKGTVHDHVWRTEEVGGKYVSTVELFVEGSSIPNFDTMDEVQVNYAWKTAGEVGYVVGNYTVFWAHRDRWTGDWFASHIGGLDVGNNDFSNGLDSFGLYADNLRITEDGLKVGFDASEAVIDGNLTEYDGLAVISASDADSTLSVTGKAGSDGLYVAITVTHNAISSVSENWWENDNFEFNINEAYNQQNVVLIKNGKLLHGAFWDKAAYITKEVDGKYVTTLELYAAGISHVYKLFVGINGTGFNGWLPIVNSGDLFFTPDGIVTSEPAYVADANLDGKLDDAIWTEEVLSKVHTTTANGATISMVGVSGRYGVHLGFTIRHTRPLLQACQGDGTQWWNYMGPEVRLGGRHGIDLRGNGTGWDFGPQIAAGAWNNTAINCSMGYTSVDNGDGTFTTVYEMFVPYRHIHSAGNRVALAVGGVFENGFRHLWNDRDWKGKATHIVTPNGIIEGALVY